MVARRKNVKKIEHKPIGKQVISRDGQLDIEDARVIGIYFCFYSLSV